MWADGADRQFVIDHMQKPLGMLPAAGPQTDVLCGKPFFFYPEQAVQLFKKPR